MTGWENCRCPYACWNWSIGAAGAVRTLWCATATGPMEELEHVRLEAVQDQPLTVLKGLGNPKWLTVFADVAINGGTRSMEELWEENGKFLRLYCYQPRTGCCALVLADLTRENSLIQELFQRGR
mgnify:CR=1 FL=1